MENKGGNPEKIKEVYKVKRKIFSVLLALVLVCSFSLVTAVPVVAVATLEVSKWTEDATNPIFDPEAKAYYPTVVKVSDSDYRMWYGSGSGVGYATSSDGLGWTEQANPVTGLVNANHPLVEYYEDSFAGANSGNNPSTDTMYFRMWYWPGLSYTINDIRYAESADGTAWYNDQPLQNGIVPIISAGDPLWNRGSYGPADVLYNPEASNTGTDWTFTMYYDGTTGGGEIIGLGFSSDGIIWTGYDADVDGKADPVLEGSGLVGEWDMTYVSRCTVIKGDDGTYRMWFSGGDGRMDHGIGYATSSDGMNWTKDANNPIFHKTDGISWRDERSYCPMVIEDGGIYKMWFSGKDAGGNYAIGYATNTNPDAEYTTIQAAIDSADPGDTISVAAGTYGPFTVDGKTDLTIQSGSEVTVQGMQSVTTAYGDRDCVVFVKDSTNIVLDDLNIQGEDLGTINTKNYGVIYEASSGEIKDCTVSPNTIGDMLSIAIGIWDGSEVTVDPCTLENFGRVGMLIYNACTVEVLDSTIEGQVYSGEGEVCYGIEVEGAYDDATPATASQVTIRGNEIYNCDNTFYEAPTWQSGGVYINGWLEYYPEADSTVIVENNDIHDNYSGIIVIKSPTSYAHFNDIYDNRAFGVESIDAWDASTAVFDAEVNWWGDATGPDHASNPLGTGDSVSDSVDFFPWALNEGCTEIANSDTTVVVVDDDWVGSLDYAQVLVDATDYYIGVNAFAIIQDGIGAVAEAGTVSVAVGTYNENITIDKSLIVEGANHGVNATAVERGPESIINAQEAEFAVLINGAETVATFDGFTVENYDTVGILGGAFSTALEGVTLGEDPLEVHILNNIVKPPTIEPPHNNNIQVGDGTTGTIIGNEVSGAFLESGDWSGSGIIVAGSSNVVVSNNHADDCEGGIQILGYA